MEETKPMNALKPVPISDGQFMANGKLYIIESGFSIERFALYQQYQIEAGYGVSFVEMLKNWERVVNYANALRFTDIAVLAHNMVRGVAKIADREPVLLKMCALFINEQNEDRRTINPDIITAKINDWRAEGYDIRGFFTLASNIITGFIEHYERLSRVSLETEKITKPTDKSQRNGS
jgi:hypothetical protein